MLKIITIVLIICAACWFGYIGMQQKYNVPVAEGIITQKMEEFKSAGYDALAQKAGTGLLVEYGGSLAQKFPVKYAVEKVPGAEGATVKTLKISGRVECIQLFPFTDIRIGPSFEMLLSKDSSYQEAP